MSRDEHIKQSVHLTSDFRKSVRITEHIEYEHLMITSEHYREIVIDAARLAKDLNVTSQGALDRDAIMDLVSYFMKKRGREVGLNSKEGNLVEDPTLIAMTVDWCAKKIREVGGRAAQKISNVAEQKLMGWIENRLEAKGEGGALATLEENPALPAARKKTEAALALALADDANAYAELRALVVEAIQPQQAQNVHTEMKIGNVSGGSTVIQTNTNKD